MKKFFSKSLMLICAALIATSCGGQKGPNPEISELTAYTDPSTKMEIKYPKGWVKGSDQGHSFIAYSSPEAKKEFLDLNNMDAEEVPGARMHFVTIKLEEGKTVEDMVNATRPFETSTYSTPQNVTIDGTPAVKQTISFPFKTTNFNGELYYATKDSQIVNVIMFDVIGDQYDALKPKFQEIISSMKLGVAKQKKVKVDTVNKELPLPSDKFVASSGTSFSIQIPDNFVPNKSGNTYYVSGSRRSDCSMQIDIVPHKGKQLNKIAEEFETSYGKSSKTSIGGSEAYMFSNPKAGRDVDSKLYFTMHNGKMYRVVVSFYKGGENKGEDAKVYRATFSKMLKSIKWS